MLPAQPENIQPALLSVPETAQFLGVGRSTVYALVSTGDLQAVKIGCPYRKLDPDVLVVQSAQDWHGQNTTDGLDGARYRRILIQG